MTKQKIKVKNNSVTITLNDLDDIIIILKQLKFDKMYLHVELEDSIDAEKNKR